ncbi:MAG: hypothetical protein ACUVWY_10865 [Desulfosoma sp.]|uniref:hypothetical protein n=1 Tax=Desulfosoma sp. TaxID=2603217 RepID=UPI00404A869E
MGPMAARKSEKPTSVQDLQEAPRRRRSVACLDTEGLRRLEESFRRWVDAFSTHRPARLRIFLLYLLIHHSGAKLNEVLRLNTSQDIDWNARCLYFRTARHGRNASFRVVDVSRYGLEAIRAVVEALIRTGHLEEHLDVDAPFVRRKFYERAEACGFSRRWAHLK